MKRRIRRTAPAALFETTHPSFFDRSEATAPQTRRRLELVTTVAALVTAMMVVVTHIEAVGVCSLPIVGQYGTEYTLHTERELAQAHTEGVAFPLQLVRLPMSAAVLDGGHPPMLHLLSCIWATLFGRSVSASLHLNLVYLVLAALSAALFAQYLAASWTQSGYRRIPWVTGATVAVVLLLPGLFASARRYDVALPLTAWCTTALAASVFAPRSTPAAALMGLASAMALLTRWSAAVYLLPIWIGPLARMYLPDWEVDRRRPMLRILFASGVAVALCLPVILQTQGVVSLLGSGADVGSSLDRALSELGGVMSAPNAWNLGPGVFAGRLNDLVDGLVRAALGPGMAVVLLVAAIGGRQGWRPLAAVAALSLVPLLLVSLFVPRDAPLERYLLPVLPWLAAGCIAAVTQNESPFFRLIFPGVILAVGAVQLASVDGIVDLPSVVAPQSPDQLDGWNVVDDAARSPHVELEEVAMAACSVEAGRGQVFVDEDAWAHEGVRHYLHKHCSQPPTGAYPGLDEATPLGLAGGAPAAALTTERMPRIWGAALEGVVLQFDRRTVLHLYLR